MVVVDYVGEGQGVSVVVRWCGEEWWEMSGLAGGGARLGVEVEVGVEIGFEQLWYGGRGACSKC